MRVFFSLLGLIVVMAILGKVGKTQLESLASVAAGVRSVAPPASQAGEVAAGSPRDSGVVAVPGGMPGAAPAGADGTVGYQARQVQNDFMNATNRALQAGPDRIKRAEP